MKEINEGNVRVLVPLFTLLIVVALSLISYEIYTSLKKARARTDLDRKYEYVLMEDEYELAQQEDRDLGIRDI